MATLILRPQEVEKKIDFFHTHRQYFHIVTDFDGTLTHYFDHTGKSRPSVISLLYNEGLLDEEYTLEAKQLFDRYIIIEKDTTLPMDFRQQQMEQRRSQHKELLMRKRLNYHHLEKIATMDQILIRSGVTTFLKQMYGRDIPVVIFSASGVGVDSIELLLKHRGLSFPNITIVSNRLYRDEDGYMTGYSTPSIHSLNKTESVIWEDPQYTSLQQKLTMIPHAIVIGDNIHDANMVNKKDDRTIISLGFCNDKVEEKIQEYSDTFDIVVTHDEGFEKVNNLLILEHLTF